MKSTSPNNIEQAAAIAEPKAFKRNTSKVLLMFILKFAVLFLLFEACYFNDYLYNHVFSPINKAFAFLATKILSMMGMNTSNQAEIISSSQFSMSVKQGCDSMEALAIFVFGVIAFPAKVMIKLKGLVIGTVLILSMNLIRLVSLFWIGVHYHDLFDLFHLEIWQGFFIVFSIILWIVWVIKAIQSPKTISDDK